MALFIHHHLAKSPSIRKLVFQPTRVDKRLKVQHIHTCSIFRPSHQPEWEHCIYITGQRRLCHSLSSFTTRQHTIKAQALLWQPAPPLRRRTNVMKEGSLSTVLCPAGDGVPCIRCTTTPEIPHVSFSLTIQVDKGFVRCASFGLNGFVARTNHGESQRFPSNFHHRVQAQMNSLRGRSSHESLHPFQPAQWAAVVIEAKVKTFSPLHPMETGNHFSLV